MFATYSMGFDAILPTAAALPTGADCGTTDVVVDEKRPLLPPHAAKRAALRHAVTRRFVEVRTLPTCLSEVVAGPDCQPRCNFSRV